MSTISQINKFFEIAKPEKNLLNFYQQLIVHLEEQMEFFEALGWGDESEIMESLKFVQQSYKDIVKRGSIDYDFYDVDQILLLDSLVDSQVTGQGLAYYLDMSYDGAAKEVAASNLSKFYYLGSGACDISDNEYNELNNLCKKIEAAGRYKGVYWERVGDYAVFFDENKKILKSPKTYFEPELAKFIKGE